MNYHQIIRSEFERRRKKDLFYSLRQFARDLDLTPMHLSYLLRGERGLSKHKALQVAYRLGIKGYMARSFQYLVVSQSGRSKSQRQLAKQALQRKWMQIGLQKLWTA